MREGRAPQGARPYSLAVIPSEARDLTKPQGDSRVRSLSLKWQFFPLAKTDRRLSKVNVPMPTKTEEKPAVDKVTAARNKNLDLAIQQIAKDYGEGAIMRLGDDHIVDIDVIPNRKYSDRSCARRRRFSARPRR